jgi:hypothetical protein
MRHVTKKEPLSSLVATDGSQKLVCREFWRFCVVSSKKDETEEAIVRFTVVSDAYQMQSSAKAEIFDGHEWHVAAYLVTGEMSTPHGLYYQAEEIRRNPETSSKKFRADIEALVDQIVLVLGGIS